MHLWWAASLVWCIHAPTHLWWAAYMMRCIYGVLNLWCGANLVNYIFIAIFLWWTTSSVCCIIGAMYSIYTFYMHFWYALASLVCWIVGALQLWWIISWLQYFFGVLYLRCVASLVLCICTFGMLCIGIFGGASLVRLLLCNASLVHCFLVLGAIYFWCCVFGAMHCQLYRAGLLPQWRIYFINREAGTHRTDTRDNWVR